MSSKLAHLMQRTFCSDQNSYILQLSDGNYHRTYGLLDAGRIENNILRKKSFGSYQKNLDSTINWICFDFDVAKEYLNKPSFKDSETDLHKIVDCFCETLSKIRIPFLLEFSGNRGMHVWIIFSERIEYYRGYMISKAIIDATELTLPPTVHLDLFPASKRHSDGVGLGVKLPLSKHEKSGTYSLLLQPGEKSSSALRVEILTEEIKSQHVEILSNNHTISKIEIESRLNDYLELEEENLLLPLRIKEINISSTFNFTVLSNLWNECLPLGKLIRRISIYKSLVLAERKLIVGLLTNVKLPGKPDFSKKILHHIFSKIEGYDKERTEENLEGLASFNFPTQEQIESVTSEKFTSILTTDELVAKCIPKLTSFIDSTLEISVEDIEVVRKAEIKYILQNDEVYSKRLLIEINYRDGREILSQVVELLSHPRAPEHYLHHRVEEKKTRILTTLGTVGRITTSAILNQIIHLLKFRPSANSHGYQVSQGFKDGYIFKPWLNLWVRFVNNISSAIESVENRSYYIVKTDIESFYDTVPHENLKRLLLGGVNKKIDSKIKLVSEDNLCRYRSLLESLFSINATLVNSDRGLPQGPAYARFLAELYIDNIDVIFDNELISGDVFLYQRYVDDIFFICETEERARSRLDALGKSLQILGLKINHEKTIVSRISDFSNDFRKFTSQSKYVVDRASRNFESSTPTEKDLAINEFIKIVQADSCEDDLAFIFSHLAGVSVLDSLKKEKVIPTLKKGIGRGSMLRHLFTFVLASEARWPLLLDIENYSTLQSEVLTSSLLLKASSIEGDVTPFLSIASQLIPKLSRTQIVDEHLAYLSFIYGIDVDKSNFTANIFLKCISSYPEPQSIILSEETIRKLSLTLNSQQEMGGFIDSIYPLCISMHTPRSNLNELAQTFFSKVSNDYRLEKLNGSNYLEMHYESPATKFYYLLCLFSLSDQNDDIELLKELWKYATEIHNLVQPSTRNTIHSDEWFGKLDHININPRTNNFVVSSIVEGAMYRGGNHDKNKIFDRFHNLLIIFIAGHLKSDAIIQIEKILNGLKLKANFYKWILERENVSVFPNISWFEKNVCENNIVILKKGTEILIRRPTSSFVVKNNLSGDHNGYSERIESYDESSFISLKNYLVGMSLAGKIDILISIIEISQETQSFPNIYSSNRLIKKSDLSSFTKEVDGNKKILFEDGLSSVVSLSNNAENFIRLFFRMDFPDESAILFKKLRDKYIANISNDLDIYRIVKYIKNELEQISRGESEIYLDFAVGSSLYLSLDGIEYEKKLELFVNTYEKFNKNESHQHIYCVKKEMIFNGSTPLGLFSPVISSLNLVIQEVMPSSTFNLGSDVEEYFRDINVSISNNHENDDRLDLSLFVRTRVLVLQTESKIDSRESGEFDFEKVYIVNVKLSCVEKFDFNRHPIIIGREKYVYQFVSKQGIYILPILNSVGKIFDSLVERHGHLLRDDTLISYPIRVAGELNISLLSDYDRAVQNVSVQRDIGSNQAEVVLKNWLASIPVKYRSPLCTLIAAHVVMTPEEVAPFVHKVSELILNSKENPFFIKRIGDINGTHRILMRDTDVIRLAERLGPHNISINATSITLIVDILVSGSQIVKALRYYALDEGADQKYYLYSEDEKRKIAGILKLVKTIYIADVFHTKSGLQYIQDQCREFLHPEINVVSLHGRDIGEDAFFGTSRNISAAKKKEIRSLFDEKDFVDELFNHLKIYGRTKSSAKEFRGKKIDGIDLVARYQSLTKKCFYFLHSGLKHNSLCRPFIRARDSEEIANDEFIKK